MPIHFTIVIVFHKRASTITIQTLCQYYTIGVITPMTPTRDLQGLYLTMSHICKISYKTLRQLLGTQTPSCFNFEIHLQTLQNCVEVHMVTF